MAVTRTDKPDKTGLNHTHGLSATDTQIAALKAADAALAARVTALEKPVDPPKPPDPPGPEPGGTQPPSNVDRTGQTDTTATLMSFLEGPAKKIDLGGGKYLVSQIASTTLRDKEVYNGELIQTKVLMQNGPGMDSALVWLQSGTGGLWFHEVKFTGKYAGRPAGSDGKTLAEEVNHGIHSQGTQGLILTNCDISAFGGDGVYIGGWLPLGAPQSADITVQDSTILRVGRMSIAAASGGQRVQIVHNAMDVAGWNVGVTIEPNGDAPGGKPELYSDWKVLSNLIGRGNSAKYTFVVTNSSNKGGNPVTIAGIVVSANKTMYADTPWNPTVYSPWASGVTITPDNK